jgi:N-acetylglutamate synthase-like GNAT family acetyltransferase
MSAPVHRIRRATVDDLPHLQTLWAKMHLPAAELERRPTEFQVAEAEDGALLGAIAMEISERTGRIHSETYLDFANADELRQSLWERLQSLATNHGIARLWTRETAPFWSRNGFHAPGADELKRLPPAWGADTQGLLTVQLRDEKALEKALDKEFTRFKLEEKRRTEQLMRKGKILKFISTLLAVLLFIGVVVFGFVWMMQNYPRFFGR